jgi:hypothetical protein
MITFPTSPAPQTNDIYPPIGSPAINGRRWKFNGVAWDVYTPPISYNDLVDVPSEFPVEAHDHAISEVVGLQTALDIKADLVNGKVPAIQLPSFVDDVVEHPTYEDFPGVGTTPGSGEQGKIYVALDTSLIYRWSGTQYVIISASPGTTDDVPQGTGNLYYSSALASADAPVQTVAGRVGDVVLTSADITDFSTAVTGTAPAPTTSANAGISITGTNIDTAYNTSVGDAVVSVAVGGAPAAAASSWKAKNIVQVLDDILFPTILASVGTAKSVDLAVSGSSGTLEIGTSHSRTLTATFNQGTIRNGTGATNSNPLVGAATDYTFTGTGITSTTQTGNQLTFNSEVQSGSNSWGVAVAHDAGTGTYTDNKGVSGTNLNSQRVAGTATDSSSSPAITGIHPYYYYKSTTAITTQSMVTAIQNGTATKVLASSTGTITAPWQPTDEYYALAYPATSTTKTFFYVTDLNSGNMVATGAWHPVSTPTSVTTANWTQDYRIHVTTSQQVSPVANIQFRNS